MQHFGKTIRSSSEGKLIRKSAMSTAYSLMTDKKVKNQEEVLEAIKRKRVKSYQKISFSIRRMDEMFKGEYKARKKSESNDPEVGDSEVSSPVRKKLKIQEKLDILHNEDAGKRLKTSCNFHQASKSKGNLIHRMELLNDPPLRKGSSQSKKQLFHKNPRIRTQYCEDSASRQLGNQLLFRKQTISPSKGQKKTNIVTELDNQKQESMICIKKSIPGLKFKINQVLQTENSQTDSIELDRKNSNCLRTTYIPGDQSFYMHRKDLLSRDKSQKVGEMYRLRTDYDLDESPKQWHLYDCLKLSQLSLYRTNLKLSCESWVLFDYLELKYLRGWNPKQQGEFNVVVRLLVTRMLLTVEKKGVVNFRDVKIKINNVVVRNKVEDNSAVLVDSDFSLSTNTVISLWDLFVGMLLTKKEDLVWHLIYGLCHLHRNYNLELDEKDSYMQLQTVSIPNDKEKLEQLQEIFMFKVSKICQQLKLKETTLQLKRKKMDVNNNEKTIWGANTSNSVFKEDNTYQYLLVKSSCLDVSIVFVDCLRFPSFAELVMQAHPAYTCKVKHQIGYKFWQTRSCTFKNNFSPYNNNNFIAFIGRNEQSKNFTILAYHYIHKVVVVCNDCKINMCLRDINSIVNWMTDTFRRFGGKDGKNPDKQVHSLERPKGKNSMQANK